jgi:hypothetical protein
MSRTSDTRFRKPLLYPLSYGAVKLSINIIAKTSRIYNFKIFQLLSGDTIFGGVSRATEKFRRNHLDQYP